MIVGPEPGDIWMDMIDYDNEGVVYTILLVGKNPYWNALRTDDTGRSEWVDYDVADVEAWYTGKLDSLRFFRVSKLVSSSDTR